MWCYGCGLYTLQLDATVIEMARVALWSSGDRMVHVTMELMYEHHSQRPTYIYFDRIGIIQTTAISAID